MKQTPKWLMKIVWALLLTYITTGALAQPVISTFSPQTGTIGTSVTINGSGFSATPANNIVYFGAVKASVTSASPSSLTVTVPAGATFQPISVTVSNLTGYSSIPFRATFTPSGTGFNSASFEPKKEFPAHSDPYNIVTGDFDADGKPDVAVPNPLNQSITVSRNTSTTGAISFGERQFFSFSGDQHLCTADFDGDGLLDIAGADASSAVMFLRNTSTVGNISFANDGSAGAGSWTNSVEAADIDLDGKPDLIVTNQFSNSCSILRNTSVPGDISFATGVNLSTGTSSFPVYAIPGDFDGDGKLDVVVSCNYGTKVGIFRNTTSSPGTITFAARTDLTALSSPWGLSAGDLDGDGKQDLVVAYSGSGSVSIFRNTSTSAGTISFAARADMTGGSSYGVTVGDIDGDGKPDIASGRTSVFRNISSGGTISFAAAVAYTTVTNGPALCGLSICDLDLDGRPDVSVAGSGGQYFAVLRNRIGAPGIVSFSPANAAPGQTVTINGSYFNGATEVKFAGVPATSFNVVNASTITAVVPGIVSGKISVTSAFGIDSLGLFYNGPTLTSFTPASGNIGTSVTITGSVFNAIAANNIVHFGAVRATVTNANASSLTVTVPAGATNEPISVTAHGFTAYSSKPFNVTFAGGGTALVAQSFLPKGDSSVAAGPEDVLAGDLDGDGKADVIAIAKTAAQLSVLRNTGSFENVSFAANMNFGIPANPKAGAIGDVDGDGKLDVVIVTGNYVSVFRNTSTVGNISFAARQDISFDSYNGKIAIGDLDKDGRPDIVVGYGSSINVFRNISSAGNILFQAPVAFTGSNEFGNISIADLNADGKSEIITYGTDQVNVFRNTTGVNGTINFANAVTFWAGGYAASDIAVCDMNADNKPDIIVAVQNAVSVLRNTSTGANSVSFATKIEYSLPQYTAAIAVNDLDGDGKPDIAVGYTNNAFVTVLKNLSTAAAAFTASSFAAAIDYTTGVNPKGLVIADADNDGQVDLITANHTDNTISVLRNVVGKYPTLTSFRPTTAGIGATIDLTGTNFNNVTAVKFGNVNAASFTVNSSTSITAITGLGATGEVSVITPNGTALLTGFVSTAPPVVSSFTPSSGNSLWTNVTITGINFSNATAVSFGGVAADSFSIVSPTQINAIVGVGGASGDVSVTSPNGTGSLAGFNYVPVPVITSFTPEAAAIGSTITITGNNFSLAPSDNIVFFGAAKATVLSATATTLTVKVPIGASHAPISVTTANKLIAYSKKPFIGTFNGSNEFSNASFDTTTNYVPGSRDVVVADIDIDGKPDLVNMTGSDIKIFRNTSNGGSLSFAPFITLQGGAIGDARVMVTDLDGDGKPDIATTRGNSSQTIGVFRNTSSPGSISFAARQHIATGYVPVCFASGDLDGDGKPEIVTGQGNHTTISILKNTSTVGNISFATNIDLAVGLNPKDIKIADADGDKKPDILTIVNLPNSSDAFLYVWRNMSLNGIFDFPVKNSFALKSPMSMATGDLDGDGQIDVVTTHINGCISVLRNTSVQGTVSFAPKFDSCYSAATRGISIADINGDGKLDIAVTDNIWGKVGIFRNISTPGAITLAARKDYSAGRYHYSPPYYLDIGDLDADGKLDIVTSNSTDVSVLRNRMGESTSTNICSGAGTNITSSITGSNYQWQINRGNGFVNIADSATYTGTNTATLQLSNLPTAWYGYQFRCLVDGNESNWFSLKFTNTWTGSASNAWENPANWSCGIVPDGKTDVVITSGTIVINSNVSIRSLTTQPGVNLTVAPGYTITLTN